MNGLAESVAVDVEESVTEREGEIVEVFDAANIMDEAVKGLPVVVAEGEPKR